MSQRYTKIFNLKKNLYCEGANIIIADGAIQLNNQNFVSYAQLKFKNISEKTIIMLHIKLSAVTKDGKKELVEFTYRDLSAEGGATFGEKTLIQLPTKSTEIKVISVSIAFTNGDEEKYEGKWCAIRQSKITRLIPEYYQQLSYAKRFGKKATRVPCGTDKFWLCTCATPYTNSEDFCPVCNATREELSNIDKDALLREGALMVANEYATSNKIKTLTLAERALEYIEPSEEKNRLHTNIQTRRSELISKRNKRTAIIVSTSIFAVILITILILTLTVFIPNSKYNDARELYNDEKYAEAVEIYIEIDDYKDSEKRIAIALNVANYKADEYYSSGDYTKAYNTIRGFYENSEIYDYLTEKLYYNDDLDNRYEWYKYQNNYDYLYLDIDFYSFLKSVAMPKLPIDPDNDSSGNNGTSRNDAIDLSGISEYNFTADRNSTVWFKLEFENSPYTYVTIEGFSSADIDATLYDEQSNTLKSDLRRGNFYINCSIITSQVYYLAVDVYPDYSTTCYIDVSYE